MSGEGLSAEERVELFARGVIQHHVVEAVERIVARRESEAAEKARAEGWQIGHDAACPQGGVCSAHQPLADSVAQDREEGGE